MGNITMHKEEKVPLFSNILKTKYNNKQIPLLVLDFFILLSTIILISEMLISDADSSLFFKIVRLSFLFLFVIVRIVFMSNRGNDFSRLLLSFDQKEECNKSVSTAETIQLSEEEVLVNKIRDLLKSDQEIYVLFRKDLVSTLSKVPHPDAIFSYILLEGVSDMNLFDSKKSQSSKENVGNYILTSCEIEKILSKIESILELRKAKKSLEFHKIQTQIAQIFVEPKKKEIGDLSLDNLFIKHNISERECDIVKCILKGFTNKEISLELCISVETVKTHVKNILKKCKISSRLELIRLFSNTPHDFM